MEIGRKGNFRKSVDIPTDTDSPQLFKVMQFVYPDLGQFKKQQELFSIGAKLTERIYLSFTWFPVRVSV